MCIFVCTVRTSVVDCASNFANVVSRERVHASMHVLLMLDDTMLSQQFWYQSVITSSDVVLHCILE